MDALRADKEALHTLLPNKINDDVVKGLDCQIRTACLMANFWCQINADALGKVV